MTLHAKRRVPNNFWQNRGQCFKFFLKRLEPRRYYDWWTILSTNQVCEFYILSRWTWHLYMLASPAREASLFFIFFLLPQSRAANEEEEEEEEREGKNKVRMQALVAAMAAHALSLSALAPPSTATPSSAVLQSSFSGITVRVSNAPFLASVSAVKRPLTVLAVTKKAVAVLKGNSAVEGVVQLLQEDDGMIISH